MIAKISPSFTPNVGYYNTFLSLWYSFSSIKAFIGSLHSPLMILSYSLLTSLFNFNLSMLYELNFFYGYWDLLFSRIANTITNITACNTRTRL